MTVHNRELVLFVVDGLTSSFIAWSLLGRTCSKAWFPWMTSMSVFKRFVPWMVSLTTTTREAFSRLSVGIRSRSFLRGSFPTCIRYSNDHEWITKLSDCHLEEKFFKKNDSYWFIDLFLVYQWWLKLSRNFEQHFAKMPSIGVIWAVKCNFSPKVKRAFITSKVEVLLLRKPWFTSISSARAALNTTSNEVSHRSSP